MAILRSVYLIDGVFLRIGFHSIMTEAIFDGNKSKNMIFLGTHIGFEILKLIETIKPLFKPA